VVNGPEGPRPEPDLDVVDWDWVDWSGCEREVRRLRQRIFKATQEGDWPRVRSLQKLMLRSRSNTLLSVRQVTQRNAGRKTAGIDGEVALTSQARADVAGRVHSTIATWQPPAVKRVYLPKAANRAKLRPRGIPVIMDRCHQARVRNALEPRMGGPVRAKIVWVSAGSQLPGRDRGDLRDLQGPPGQAGVGAGCGSGRGVR
jgi:RNA-directed DNA polymerase